MTTPKPSHSVQGVRPLDLESLLEPGQRWLDRDDDSVAIILSVDRGTDYPVLFSAMPSGALRGRSTVFDFLRDYTPQNLESWLTAAITRDREQGRAADAAEIVRLRDALEEAGDAVLLAADIAEADDIKGVPPRCEPLEAALKRVAGIAARALAAPFAPATTGKEPTK